MRLSIKGIPVKLSVKTQTGIDGFNRPTYEVFQEVVENVLVGEPSAEDVVNELNLSGKRIAYTLAIPKGDTHVWEDTEVEFFGRKFRTIGLPTEGIEENLPLSWNKKVKVERYE
ncbi:Uncharacterised protein [uncultured Ruminococcus sp.]|jgi:hypothetical protein|uniref:Phage protein n=1 Tax=Hominimerdicola aceti TaxID=2981726 RepID=A0AAE3IHP4_9FIRM|nr:hypothetical protein [Hominimerdicola aceti]MCU6706421.1 hypothetical protein [Hominimerdicola aceti]SCJ05917.1 Uncharacterised protein [uncultured Ruminococcus sp.]